MGQRETAEDAAEKVSSPRRNARHSKGRSWLWDGRGRQPGHAASPREPVEEEKRAVPGTSGENAAVQTPWLQPGESHLRLLTDGTVRLYICVALSH